LPNQTMKERKSVPRKEKLAKELLRLRKKTSWSWERVCHEFHRVMGHEGPSHATLFRYSTGKVTRPHVVINITVELSQKEDSPKQNHRA